MSELTEDHWSWQVGNRIYTKPAKKLCRENITTFLDLAMPLISAENYTAVVIGRVLYDIAKTGDFDFWLQGPVSDINRLENLLYNLYDIAYLQAGLLVDIKWTSVPWSMYNDPQHGVVNSDAESISSSYYELKNPKGNSWKIDRRLFPIYTPITEWLVKSNFKNIPKNEFKPHQIEYVTKYGRDRSVSVEEFLQNLDHYLAPLEKTV